MKIARIMETLSPQDQRFVAFEVHRTYGGPLTNTERSQRNRGTARNEIVASDATARATKRNETVPGVHDFLRFYSEKFGLVVGSSPAVNYGKDGSIAKKLLRQYGQEQLRELLQRFFHSEDEFIRKSGYTLGVFQSVLNKLLVEKNGGGPLTPSVIWREAQREKGGQP